MLTINNPDDAEKRQNVAPLSIDDEKHCVDILNAYIKSHNTMLNGSAEAFIQRFIHNYENLKHFYAVAGGWDGLEKLKSVPSYIDGINNFPDCSKHITCSEYQCQSPITVTEEIKVNYEIVKGKDHE